METSLVGAMHVFGLGTNTPAMFCLADSIVSNLVFCTLKSLMRSSSGPRCFSGGSFLFSSTVLQSLIFPESIRSYDREGELIFVILLHPRLLMFVTQSYYRPLAPSLHYLLSATYYLPSFTMAEVINSTDRPFF